MTGYQKLKESNIKLQNTVETLREIVYQYEKTLMEISRMKGPDIVHAPSKALDILAENKYK